MFVMGWCQNPLCGSPYVAQVADESPLELLPKACSKRCKQSRKRQRYVASRHELCGRPGKQIYTSLERALGQVVKQSLHAGHALYPYQCSCKWWHLTSERKKRNKWLAKYPEIYSQLPTNMSL